MTTVNRKILVMGLPGAGKTSLSEILAARLNAVHFNADAVRENINKDLTFTHADRVEQSRRMGWLCDRVVSAGGFAIADFICPTHAARDAFGDAFVIWVDRIKSSRFADTNAMFEPPTRYDMRVTAEGEAIYWVEQAYRKLVPEFNARRPTALFVGRFQPFHDGHRKLIEEGIRRVGQACIAVRDTHGIDAKNPLAFEAVKIRIEAGLRSHLGRFIIVQVPNITNIFYGRDVGYSVERLILDQATEQISATNIRRALVDNSFKPVQARQM